VSEGYEDVMAVSFRDDSNAYRALSVLEDLRSRQAAGARDRMAVAGFALDGDVAVVVAHDHGGRAQLDAPARALLTWIAGGPLGLVVADASGALAGTVSEAEDDDRTRSVLTEISRSLGVERTTLLAQLLEPDYAAVDNAVPALRGTAVRERVTATEAEIAAAEAAGRDTSEKRRHESHDHGDAPIKPSLQAKIEALKARLHRRKGAPPAGASA